jgi:hypothetical protein
MAYCTTDELAAALRIRITAANEAALEACVDAAAQEIDAGLDRFDDEPIPVAPDAPPLVNRDNVYRAVQWWKANDVALGGAGYADIGLLNAPTLPFTPMSERPYRQQWGLA